MGRQADGGKGKRPRQKAGAARKPKSKRAPKGGGTKEARKRLRGTIDPKVGIIAKDPLRAEIVAIAIQRLYCPSECARDAGIGLGSASYHFKVLRDHDILELVRVERVGSALRHMYRANEAAFIDDREWGVLAQVLRPGVIGTTVENFNARIAQAGETGALFSREDACIYWAPRDYDEIAWLEQVEIVKWCIEASEQLEVDTVERRAKGESSGCFKATFAIFSFPSPTHSELKAHEQKTRKQKGVRKSKSKAKKPKGKGKKA